MLATLQNSTEQLLSRAEAPIKLYEQLIRLIHKDTRTGLEGIQRIEVPLVDTDPLLWLQAQDVPVKTYWSDRDQKLRIAGIGDVLTLKGSDSTSTEMLLQRMRRILLKSSDAVRFYGGMRFNPDIPASKEWRNWSSVRFVLPEIELTWNQGCSNLACNVNLSETWDQSRLEGLRQRLEKLAKPKSTSRSIYRYLKRTHLPGYADWGTAVEKTLKQISAKVLQKVVLARAAEFELEQAYDPLELLGALRMQAPHAYHFCFQLSRQQAFLGITPECLYSRSSRWIQTEAVASTRPRSRIPGEDERLAAELMKSAKEIREHQMVLERMEQVMQKFCMQTSRSSFQELLKLRHVQHLRSRIEGQLKPEVYESTLFPAFHPTPAVCGTPDAEARSLIEELEPFDRGWYAGPVGWVNRKGAEFAVAIRSGLLLEKKLKIFTGAGIVQGSESESEWNEIEDKLRSWESILESV